jgi:hypothetical protein
MKEIDKIKKHYSIALENYRINNPVLHPAELEKRYICDLCGGSVKSSDLSEHMQKHELFPPPNLLYQLCEPFKIVNGKIANGAKFIKLLWIKSTTREQEFPYGHAESVPYNALNLQDWTKVTDTEEVRIRWSAKKQRFIRTLWFLIVLILIQLY